MIAAVLGSEGVAGSCRSMFCVAAQQRAVPSSSSHSHVELRSLATLYTAGGLGQRRVAAGCVVERRLDEMDHAGEQRLARLPAARAADDIDDAGGLEFIAEDVEYALERIAVEGSEGAVDQQPRRGLQH